MIGEDVCRQSNIILPTYFYDEFYENIAKELSLHVPDYGNAWVKEENANTMTCWAASGYVYTSIGATGGSTDCGWYPYSTYPCIVNAGYTNTLKNPIGRNFTITFSDLRQANTGNGLTKGIQLFSTTACNGLLIAIGTDNLRSYIAFDSQLLGDTVRTGILQFSGYITIKYVGNDMYWWKEINGVSDSGVKYGVRSVVGMDNIKIFSNPDSVDQGSFRLYGLKISGA